MGSRKNLKEYRTLLKSPPTFPFHCPTFFISLLDCLELFIVVSHPSFITKTIKVLKENIREKKKENLRGSLYDLGLDKEFSKHKKEQSIF